jgi:hypothetical protein
VVATAPVVNAPAIQVDVKRRNEVRSDVTPNLTLTLPPDMIASGIPETLAIYRRPVRPADTSFRNAVALDLTVVPPPFVNPAHWAPAKFWWQPDDASSGTPKPLFTDATAPAFNPPQHQADRIRPVVDTSHGTPKTLTADAQAPVFNAPFLVADRVRPVTDTSQGISLGLRTFDPGDPLYQHDWPAPIAYRHLQLHGWDQQAAVWTIPDALPEEPPASSTRLLPRHKPVIWVHLKSEDEEVTVAEEDAAEAAEKLARKAVKRITRSTQTPAITVEGPVSRETKREIRAAFRAEFNRDAGVVAAKALLRAQQEQEDEETLLWLI